MFWPQFGWSEGSGTTFGISTYQIDFSDEDYIYHTALRQHIYRVKETSITQRRFDAVSLNIY
ncbi:hypothetical protein QT13_06645 [Pectobacterium brasiliense]|nr:hypothetical protein QT13_06645 [Pectobacterium brasiliense]